MPCVCGSTYPRTSWNDVAPACGPPVTFVPTSGYAVQPVVRVRANGDAVPRESVLVAVRCRPCPLASVNVKEPVLVRWTVQSVQVLGLPVGVTRPRRLPPRNVRSGV
jgi:hypothetical protein